MRPEASRQALTRQWLALLLGPVAWAAALAVLFVLTDDACARGVRTPAWAAAGIAIALALLPIPLAWSRSRRSADAHAAADRACFLARASIGLSVIFALVILLTAVPLGMLDACRT